MVLTAMLGNVYVIKLNVNTGLQLSIVSTELHYLYYIIYNAF